MQSEQTRALQNYYLQKYEDIFWVILRLGGIILQSQLGRWLNYNESDTASNTAFISKLEEAELIKRVRFGNNNIVILTHTVSRYFGNRQVIKLNGAKLKRSALIMERYLQAGYYTREPNNLRKRIEKTGALAYLPSCQQNIELLRKYIIIFEENGFNSDGLKNELAILQKRYDYQFNKSGNLDIDNRITDLYTLECINCYLNGIRIDGHPKIYADIYNVYGIPPLKLAKHIIKAKNALDVIFNTSVNMGMVYITIYSHDKENKKDMDIVYSYLCKYLYNGDKEAAQDSIKFKYFDTKGKLFSNIDPSNIV